MPFDPRTASALFAAILHEIDAPGARRSKPRTSPETALEYAQDLYDNLAPLLAAEDAKAPEDRFFGPKRFELLKALHAGIVDAALAFYGADLALQAAEEPEDPTRIERADLAPQVRDLDADMFALLWGKHRRNKPVRKRLEAVRTGQGQTDDSEDVIVEVHIAREYGLDGPLGTPEALLEAERKATRLLELQRKAPKPVQQAAVRRDATWARFDGFCHILRRAGVDLSEGDETTFGRLSPR